MHNNKVLGINGRLNLMGGDRESPVNIAKSIQEKAIFYDDTKAFTSQSPATKYVDLTITYRNNKQGHSSVWALQVKNVLGSPMYDGYSYNIQTGKISNDKIVVILPVLSYKIEF